MTLLKDVRSSADVVGIFPDEDAITRLSGTGSRRRAPDQGLGLAAACPLIEVKRPLLLRRGKFRFCHRNSIATFWPSTNPPSASPCRKAANRCVESSGDRALMNPITGIAGGCARAASGRTAAAPPRRAMKSRRLICRHRIEDCASHPTRNGASRSGGSQCAGRDPCNDQRLFPHKMRSLNISPGRLTNPCKFDRLLSGPGS
jgi:hypothetical protein